MTTEEQPQPPPPTADGGGTGDEDGGNTKKKEKKKPADLVIPPKKPKLSKAERRALQEQQRAAKASGGGKPPPPQQQQQQPQQGLPQRTQQESSNKGQQQNEEGAAAKTGSSGGTTAGKSKEDRKVISLFSHLPPYLDPKNAVETGPYLRPKSGPSSAATTSSSSSSLAIPLHPAVIELGYLYANGQIRGGNARCRAMLRVFYDVIGDFQPPSASASSSSSSSSSSPPPNNLTTDLRHQIDQWILKPSFQYWTESCRPHSVTMGNAFTFLKTAVASLERDMSRDDMVEMIQDTIEAYMRERIDLAQQAIAQQPAIQLSSLTNNNNNHNNSNNDHQPQVFLTYGNSEAIAAIFLHIMATTQQQQAHASFRVIIVDSRPLLEGKALLRTLRAANIDCSYILLNALTYVMRDVTKVYLGASALMSDGSLLGRVGTACVALSAHMHHIPVLVCCESYKISNRVQLESITGNELGNPSQVAMLGNNTTEYFIPNGDNNNNNNNHKDSVLKDWLETDNLRLLNLLYDLTPSEFVSGIVTELGIIPPTSVAVLLREMNPQN